MFKSRYLTANDRPGEYPASWYAATANALPPFAPVSGHEKCEICIIGGGFTGLSAALHLAQHGRDVLLLEAHRAGWGASGRNGGQVSGGQRVEQDELEDMLGVEKARTLWDLAGESMDLVLELIGTHGIDCDFRPGVLHADHKPRHVPHTEKLAGKLRQEYACEHVRFVPREELRAMLGTTAYHGGMLDMKGGHLHPLNFALGLARAAVAAGARIAERSPVLGYEAGDKGKPVRIRLEGARVEAEHLILACNGYLDDLDAPTARRVMPINNYIIATEPLGEDRARSLIRDDIAVADSKFVINYYRLSADHRLLFGGGESYSGHFPRDIRGFVRKPMLEIYPQLGDVKIDYGWGGTLAVTMNRLPYLANLSPRVLTATGYSGHGVAMATFAGKVLAAMLGGDSHRFGAMAAVPSPAFPGGRLLRWPLLVLGMTWYALRDRL
jgi:gamma-glutamylputrescine oxidase